MIFMSGISNILLQIAGFYSTSSQIAYHASCLDVEIECVVSLAVVSPNLSKSFVASIIVNEQIEPSSHEA